MQHHLKSARAAVVGRDIWTPMEPGQHHTGNESRETREQQRQEGRFSAHASSNPSVVTTVSGYQALVHEHRPVLVRDRVEERLPFESVFLVGPPHSLGESQFAEHVL
jgi:hypothetical protein